MPSPFPGMDPYLESPAHWSDFHATFIADLRDAINAKLPASYIARIGEHVTVVNPVFEPPGGPLFVPDVAVLRGMTDSGRGGAPAAVAVPPAVALTNIESGDPHTETYVEVRRVPDLELVTVLELLSPTNKYGDGRGEYMRKRREFRQQSINLVELDLLRAGARFAFVQALPPGHYYGFVSRAWRASITDAHAWSVRSRLPAIPIPLRQRDGEVTLGLAEPFASAYERGRYRELIDYSKPPPPPPFSSEDAQWVAQTARVGAQPS